MEKNIITEIEEDILGTFLEKFNDRLNKNKENIDNIFKTIKIENNKLIKCCEFFETYNNQLNKILKKEINFLIESDKNEYNKALKTVINNENKFESAKEKSIQSIINIEKITENFLESLFLKKNINYSQKEIFSFLNFCSNLVAP